MFIVQSITIMVNVGSITQDIGLGEFYRITFTAPMNLKFEEFASYSLLLYNLGMILPFVF